MGGSDVIMEQSEATVQQQLSPKTYEQMAAVIAGRALLSRACVFIFSLVLQLIHSQK